MCSSLIDGQWTLSPRSHVPCVAPGVVPCVAPGLEKIVARLNRVPLRVVLFSSAGPLPQGSSPYPGGPDSIEGAPERLLQA
eukprot:2917684-Pyramimonas_sp.AAC.1